MESSSTCIYPIPYERTTTYGTGTIFGPEAILAASHNVELYDEELDIEPFRTGIATVASRDFPEELPEIECLEIIYYDVKKLLADNKFIISLGGEHSITYPIVRAFAEEYKNLTVLQLDAHADLRQEYLGSRFNHACVMARVQELVKTVGAGIRSLSIEEKEEITKSKFPVWFAHQMHNNPDWMDEILSALDGPVYLTFDVDFLDPSIMPATGTPEPGGFQWHTTLLFLHRLFSEKEIVGYDVVELAPLKGLHAADFLVAKLIYKIIAFKEIANRNKSSSD